MSLAAGLRSGALSLHRWALLRTTQAHTRKRPMNQPPRRGEELPLEELDGLPDWNAQAWQAIQVRDSKNVPAQQLPGYVAGLSRPELTALRAALALVKSLVQRLNERVG